MTLPQQQYKEQEWYQELVSECKAIITEAVFTSRWALVEGYWELGKRIREENKNFERSNIYGQKIVSHVTESLNLERTENQPPISERTIWRAIQFAEKFPNLKLLPGGKNISWNKVCNELLPEPKVKEQELSELELKNHCPKCNYEW